MSRNYEEKLIQEIITGNYHRKLSKEIITVNYQLVYIITQKMWELQGYWRIQIYHLFFSFSYFEM